LNAAVDPIGFDYTELDALIKSQKPETFQTPESLTDFINKKYSTEHEKFRAIFVWVTTNIEWGNSASKYTAREVFNSRKAVENGYAELVTLLCDQCNLKSRKVVGVAKDDLEYFQTQILFEDVWNIVSINGKFYLTDLNYSADNYDKTKDTLPQDFDDTYFLLNPATFILTHFPSNPADQLLPSPISEDDFIDGPVFFEKAINYEVTSYSPSVSTLKVKVNEKIKFHFEMNYPPVHMSIQLLKTLDDLQPMNIDLPFTEMGNKINCDFQISQAGTFYLCIRFDEQDAVCYKVEVTQ